MYLGFPRQPACAAAVRAPVARPTRALGLSVGSSGEARGPEFASPAGSGGLGGGRVGSRSPPALAAAVPAPVAQPTRAPGLLVGGSGEARGPGFVSPAVSGGVGGGRLGSRSPRRSCDPVAAAAAGGPREPGRGGRRRHGHGHRAPREPPAELEEEVEELVDYEFLSKRIALWGRYPECPPVSLCALL